MDHGFGQFHPRVIFLYCIGAIGMAMFFGHPAFLLLSGGMSVLFFLTVKGRSGVRFLGGMAGVVVVFAVMNGVFNPMGDTVLFTYFGSRTFTLEALCFGLSAGVMFFTVCLWFACYNELMTSDKFLYLFGSFAPAISLVLCMVLRFLPNLKRKAQMTVNARRCIGMSPDNGAKRERLEHGMTILSVLTSWSLEGAAVTADSMNSRGYGCGERTRFAVYRKTKADTALTALMIFCIAAVAVCAAAGGMRVQYLPSIEIPRAGTACVCGLVFYGIFLAAAPVINIWEDLTWRILRSKI